MKTVNFRNFDCVATKHEYANGRIAIRLTGADDGLPVAVATTNLPNEDLPEGCAFIKEWAENEGMIAALQEAGIIGTEIKAETKTGWVIAYAYEVTL